MTIWRKILPLILLSSVVLGAHAEPKKFAWDDYYDVVTVPTPEDVDPQIGGLDLMPDGRLVACFHRGEVMILDPATSEWQPFASGLHEPLGIYAEVQGTILVIQRAEITRLHDTDGDGLADFYEVVCDDWGMSGNYHEFAFGLVKDSKGNIYVSLGTASGLGGARDEIRGPWNETGGLTHEQFLHGGEHGDWREKRKTMDVPRMYARVPYRGCILRITPGSRKAEIFATGFRTPNGLYMDAADQLWVSDNQGDWVGASKLHRVEEGKFYGHAASLLWGDNPPDVIPMNVPVAELEARRTKAAGLFPQGDAANSMTEMQTLLPSFAPVAAAPPEIAPLVVGEMNHSRLVVYLPDVVKGQQQGTGFHLVDTLSIGMGNNRLHYTAGGTSLYLGKTHLSWPGREGLKKVAYNGKPYLMVESVKLTPQGFEFTFNAPIEDPVGLTGYAVESYRIAYHVSYGSPKNELKTESSARVLIDGNVLTLELAAKPQANRVYDITLPPQITSALSPISSNRFWYTAHEVY